jgi:cytochrome c
VYILCAGLFAQSPKYGLGRTPTPEEGHGTAVDGREVYSRRCARCHGPKGEGGDEPKQAKLVGGRGSLKTAKPLKTAGSYWPYATTIWDYVNRAMPLDHPGTLTHNQVYALTAWILQMNGIVGENDVLDAKTLPRIKMPNRDGFVPDARPDVGTKPIAKAKKAAAKSGR